MKKRSSLIALAIVVVVGLIGTFVILNLNSNSKIEKSLQSKPSFTVFGYDNETESLDLSETVNVDVLEWNPESLAINLPTKTLNIRAIYDGLEAKLQFVEVTGEDGLIISHFVNNDKINIEAGSALETYLKTTQISQEEFVEYVNTLFAENNLRSKFDVYKAAFATYIEQN